MTELAEQILLLRDIGLSYRQIQTELGCSKGTISYYLGAGQKEKKLVRQRDKRSKYRKYVQEVKQSNPCTDCGENYPYWMMDFDHLSDKEFGISQLGKAANFDALKSEIAKCELVCANCHRNRTHFRLIKNGDDVLDISTWYN